MRQKNIPNAPSSQSHCSVLDHLRSATAARDCHRCGRGEERGRARDQAASDSSRHYTRPIARTRRMTRKAWREPWPTSVASRAPARLLNWCRGEFCAYFLWAATSVPDAGAPQGPVAAEIAMRRRVVHCAFGAVARVLLGRCVSNREARAQRAHQHGSREGRRPGSTPAYRHNWPGHWPWRNRQARSALQIYKPRAEPTRRHRRAALYDTGNVYMREPRGAIPTKDSSRCRSSSWQSRPIESCCVNGRTTRTRATTSSARCGSHRSWIRQGDESDRR